jgi:hypothetical protein
MRGRADRHSAEEPRTLDLLSALQFTRLHAALRKKGDNAANGKSMADARTGAAISRALKENWGLRDVKLYVAKAIAQLSDGAKKARGRPAEPFKKSERQLVVYYARLDGLTPIQRQSLRKALEELLRRLAEGPRTTPLSRRGSARKNA